ncbi:MAG: hypothetical protein Tp118SUR00d2C21406231_46 [Prokaryotic dsDNA virus sp.]|nr:MAG: hypothetical protein Tp125DCM00d2C40298531_65 [Prokaryotic dsDNA virus sp.]QDP53166.1 MAG: hypothetical protein Tp118SUR00d2C21406231_46 [Prokaryotic dsDNA virus sp.]
MTVYRGDMSKTKFIKLRVTEEEQAAFRLAAQARGKDLSEIIRDHLERLVKRMSKEEL